jgi:hypothetical protein
MWKQATQLHQWSIQIDFDSFGGIGVVGVGQGNQKLHMNDSLVLRWKLSSHPPCKRILVILGWADPKPDTKAPKRDVMVEAEAKHKLFVGIQHPKERKIRRAHLKGHLFGYGGILWSRAHNFCALVWRFAIFK